MSKECKRVGCTCTDYLVKDDILGVCLCDDHKEELKLNPEFIVAADAHDYANAVVMASIYGGNESTAGNNAIIHNNTQRLLHKVVLDWCNGSKQ